MFFRRTLSEHWTWLHGKLWLKSWGMMVCYCIIIWCLLYVHVWVNSENFMIGIEEWRGSLQVLVRGSAVLVLQLESWFRSTKLWNIFSIKISTDSDFFGWIPPNHIIINQVESFETSNVSAQHPFQCCNKSQKWMLCTPFPADGRPKL